VIRGSHRREFPSRRASFALRMTRRTRAKRVLNRKAPTRRGFPITGNDRRPSPIYANDADIIGTDIDIVA